MSMFVRKLGHNHHNYNNNNHPSNNNKPGEKVCGHNTCLLTINKCCSCSDKRPKNGGYTKYVDGQGFVAATRSEHYCPQCRDNPPVPNSAPQYQPKVHPRIAAFKPAVVPSLPPPPPPPVPSPAPTLSEFQMLASITEMGFAYPDALKALVALKSSSLIPSLSLFPLSFLALFFSLFYVFAFILGSSLSSLSPLSSLSFHFRFLFSMVSCPMVHISSSTRTCACARACAHARAHTRAFPPACAHTRTRARYDRYDYDDCHPRHARGTCRARDA
eukprot:Phypoly_transcript_11050.p1 GENE.Phypoly_transcript_11050~~Phypoly_transcript_11050.p1  ORF type:complete len:273 (+),score=40.86 Phypoly_transcript_11050:73-891(+)